MPSTPRRRRAKLPSGRLPRSQRSRRNENIRYVDRVGKGAVLTFLAVLAVGYLLISRPAVHITLAPGAMYALTGAVVSSLAALCQARRRNQ